MTHEQKPESAEFRTREAQISSLAFHLHENTCDVCWSIAGIMAEEFILEAEARGAAEQRRKDAEGAEPVGYVLAGLKELFSNPADPLSAAMILASKDAPHIVPLYTRPANVSALEARVKELEAQLGAMQHGAIRQVIHSPLRHFKPEDRS